jgi:hypothetical protein
MKKLAIAFLVFVILGFCASAVNAQTIPGNPTGAEFTPSPDHAAVSQYEIGWFLSGAVDPLSITDIGKPTPDQNNVCRVTINVMPLPFNQYTAKIRAKAGDVYSEWSEPSNVFMRIPGKPGTPVIKR